MFFKFFNYINNIFNSVDTFNRQINQYKIISKEPALPSYAYINWGLYLINAGNKEKGLEKLNQSALMNKKNPEVYLNIGVTYAQEGKFDEALKNFKKAVRLDVNNARAWGYLAGVYSEINEIKLAKSAFEKSLKLDRTNSNTYLNYGIFSIKNNQKDTAKIMLRKAYNLDPTNIQPLMMWGVILVEENEFKNAFLKFQRVLMSQPLNADALYLSGLCCLKLEKYVECVEFCKKSSTIRPDKDENYILLAEAYLNLEDKDNCLSTFSKYEKHCENDWKYYNSWGIALQHWSYWEESVEKFKKSIELNEDETINRNSLSHSLIKLNMLSEAKEQIEEVLKINPEFASSRYNLGQIYMREKEYAKAIDEYKKAVSIDTNLTKAYFNIAGAYHFKGDVKNAIKYWEKTIEYDKENQNAYINLAICSINDLNDQSKALRYIRSAYEINKMNGLVAFNYGLILLKINDVYRAQEKFIETLNLDKTLLQSKILLAQCKVKLNKPEEAIEILNNYEGDKNSKDYLSIRALALKTILTKENNVQIMDEFNEICDKIRNEYGDEAMVEELKQQKLQE